MDRDTKQGTVRANAVASLSGLTNASFTGTFKKGSVGRMIISVDTTAMLAADATLTSVDLQHATAGLPTSISDAAGKEVLKVNTEATIINGDGDLPLRFVDPYVTGLPAEYADLAGDSIRLILEDNAGTLRWVYAG